MMTGYGMPTCSCPRCGKSFNSASGLDHERKPIANDITVCVMCLLIMVFEEDLTVRKMTNEEWNELPLAHKQEIMHVADTIAAMNGSPVTQHTIKGE